MADGGKLADVAKMSFEDALEDMKRERGVINDTDLTGDDLMSRVVIYKDIVMETKFPHRLHFDVARSSSTLLFLIWLQQITRCISDF